jgi:predicted enzyme related to lactoylglutathione lyase
MWTARGVPFAGTVPFTGSYWLAYVAVADVDRAIAHATSLGGGVVFGPQEIDGVGRFAVLGDPLGASIAIYRSVAKDSDSATRAQSSRDQMPPRRAESAPPFSWHELTSYDPRAAFDFYAALFDWDLLTEPDGPTMAAGLVFGQHGVPFGVMCDASYGRALGSSGSAAPSNVWCPFVRVPDLDDTLRMVAQHGGRIVSGPTQASPGERTARFRDPADALLGAREIST